MGLFTNTSVEMGTQPEKAFKACVVGGESLQTINE